MERYRLDELIIDAAGRRVRRGGRWYPLPERSLAALLVLIEAGPEGASFTELMQGAWSGAVVGEDTIKKRMSLLRRDLGDSADPPELIQSLRGRGYRLGVPAQRMRAIDLRTRWAAGLATAASVALAVSVLVRPADAVPPAPCAVVAGSPLVSGIDVVADRLFADQRERVALELQDAVVSAGQLDQAAPYRMSARMTMERGDPVLEIALRCGDDAGGDAWVMRYTVDPATPGGAGEALTDLLARVSARAG